MKIFIRKHLLTLVFAASGAAGGFLYWKFVKCVSGTCLIKSVWYLSTLYGMVMGGLIGNLAEDIVTRFKKKREA